MRSDFHKIAIESKILVYNLINNKRSFKKEFVKSDDLIPCEEPITDTEDDEPCCRECTKKREFFVCWTIFPYSKIRIFCQHNYIFK